MKNIINIIIIGLFYILCILAFFMLVAYLPYELNELFDTHIFEGAHIVIFIVLVFILGYSLMYFQNKDEETQSNNNRAKYKELADTINLVNYLNNYDYKNLKIIQYAYYKNINDFHIIIKDTDIKIDSTFVKVDTLYNLDIELLDDCMQKYNDILDSFKISLYIGNNYKQTNN